MIRILIAEDQTLVLGALSALLRLEPDFDVVGGAADGRAALALCERLVPDIVLTDIEMPHMTGLELAQGLAQRKLACRVVVVTTFARSGYLRRAMSPLERPSPARRSTCRSRSVSGSPPPLQLSIASSGAIARPPPCTVRIAAASASTGASFSR